MMDIELTCPLGSKCEEIKDNKLHRCHWYTQMRGIDASGNDHDSYKCAMTWMPILMTEMSGTNRGQTMALESFRNEVIASQNKALDAVMEHSNARIIEAK